jgi:carboxypeptidase Taq
MNAYGKLEAAFRRLAAVEEAAGILHWDMSVMMPTGGAESRAEQLAVLRVLAHEQLVAPEVGARLDEAEADPPADPWSAANLREMRRRWRHAVAVDAGLVEALSKAGSRCEMLWRDARAGADFAAVRGALEALLALVRRRAEAKAEAFGLSPYEALLDQYEPDARVAEIDRLFDDLAGFLPGFIDDALARQRTRSEPLAPAGPFPVAAQRRLAHVLMEALGFDFDYGRLDVSLHPFCGGVPDDVRITTRYDTGDFAEALMGVLHETGHALYERHLPAAWRMQPVGRARGMALHESQSLLVEMQVCRGRAFLEFAAPLMREAFDGTGPAWEPENLSHLYARVKPDFIRVDADEVTYPAHIILRYRLETAMIAGDLAVADLPGAWNEGMREMLGIVPPDDRLGCLQDIHWYDGDFGYFPTYTMGALAAAQIYAAARAAVDDLDGHIARGAFGPLMGWLRENIHGKGSLTTTREIMVGATGAPLGTEAFKTHLRARYLG